MAPIFSNIAVLQTVTEVLLMYLYVPCALYSLLVGYVYQVDVREGDFHMTSWGQFYCAM